MPAPTLQQRTVLCGGGYRHHAEAVMPLSVKSFTGGTAFYATARGRYAVDEGSWLIINDRERYVIDFQSETLVRSTVVFFPAGWANTVARVHRERAEQLLDDPAGAGAPVWFLETVMPGDDEVCPRLRVLDAACRGRAVAEDWLEERLRDLLSALVLSQRDHRRRAGRLPAARPATRAELYRRVCRGRDFLGTEALRAPSLAEAAGAACLSPYHFQRSFRAAFGQTPHDFTTERRLAHARRLLASAAVRATEAAVAAGYDSYSAFHAAYVRRYAETPGARN
jgi:AraC family transcriptional regulator